MGRVVAIMNTKGGVGKSTTVMMLAEYLASKKDIKILIIDADSQASISNMLISTKEYKELEQNEKTLFEYMMISIANRKGDKLDNYIKHAASDVMGAQSISLLPSKIELSLLEREVMLAPTDFMKAVR